MSLESFRDRARVWLEANIKPSGEADPIDGARREPSLDEAKRFQKILAEAGFAGLTWPVEYGGQGLGSAELVAFNEEAAEFSLPTNPFKVGLGMVGPTLLELGSESQKTRYLPPLIKGEEIWCQLFSEPNAGSDVASLQTTATRTDTGWVINGQKVWTSGAQWSDFGAVIVRTDPAVPKHQGITMFIVDMHSPGVTVRPLVVATGRAPFNEVFLDNVEVPADAIIGEVNKGWSASVTMLRNERVSLGTAVRARTGALSYESLAELVRSRGGEADIAVRRRLAELFARESALSAYSRVLHEEAHAGVEIGAKGSVAKLADAVHNLWAANVAQEVLGADAALGRQDTLRVEEAMISAPGIATAGGTNEIQRNIIGERLLGLAKDPGPDRNTPFNQLRVSR